MAEQPEPHAAGFSPGRGLLVLGIVAVVLAAYFGLSALAGIEPTYAGILFIFHWTAVERSEVKRFPASLIGALAGVLAAAAVHQLLSLQGWFGPAAALGLMGGLIYLLLLKRLNVVVNDGCMLLLTVGLIPAVREQHAYGQMAAAILIAAAFMAAVIAVLYIALPRAAASPGGAAE